MTDISTVNNAVIVGSVVSVGTESNPFFFYSTEVPAQLPLGREKVLAIHRGHGGWRTFDDFGDQPNALEWSGILLSLGAIPKTDHRAAIPAQLAINRSETLDNLAKLRTPLKFKFHTYEYTGVISSYKPVVRSHNQVDYTIKFEVLSEDLKPQTDFLVLPPFKGLPVLTDFDRLARALLKTARLLLIAAKVLAALARLAIAIIKALKENPAQMFFKGLSLVPGGDIAAELLKGAESALDDMNNLVTKDIPQFLLDLEAGKPYDTLAPEAYSKYLIPQTLAMRERFNRVLAWTLNNSNQLSVTKPSDTTTSATALADARNALGILRKLMQQQVQPTDVLTITVTDPNLYQLAVKYYDDVEAWSIIAKANNIAKPVMTGTYTLKIPKRTSTTQGASTLSPVVG